MFFFFKQRTAYELRMSDWSSDVCSSDLSGLAVDALDGEPGIFSARWAETEAGRNFNEAMRRVETRLGDAGPNARRNAHFVCALALAWPDGHVEWFVGRVDGAPVCPPRGVTGFGPGPVVLPAGGHQTFGQMLSDALHPVTPRDNRK